MYICGRKREAYLKYLRKNNQSSIDLGNTLGGPIVERIENKTMHIWIQILNLAHMLFSILVN